MHIDFTSREIATGILFASIIILALVLSKDRRGLRKAFLGVLQAFGAWKVWSVFLIFLLYAAAVIFVAWKLGFWSFDQLKDTLTIVFFTGIPIIAATTSKKSGGELVKHVAKEILGVGALLIAYLNLAPLPLWGELLLQVVLLILVLCVAFGGRDPKYAPTVKFCQVLLAIIGLGLIVHTTVRVAGDFATFDWNYELAAFLLSVWLPLAFLVVVYPLGFVAACESALVRLPFHNGRERPPVRVRLALVIGFRGSLRYATRFSGGWISQVAKSRTFREAHRTMKEFRKAVKQAAKDKRQHQREVKALTGAIGTDEYGYWLDRREFRATKSVLESLAIMQMGYARNHKNRFSAEPANLLLNWDLDKLPTPHGIESRTSKDRKTWLVWRQTVGGYFFAVGGRAADITEQWRYAGTQPPSGFPGAGGDAWGLAHGDTAPSEWIKDDQPLPDVIAPAGELSF